MSESYGIIYKLTNNVNGKIYIGQTTQKLSARLYQHFNLNDKDYCRHFKRAIKKYGREGFKVEVVEKLTTIEELNSREEYWISFYNSTNRQLGYNIKLGGCNRRHCNETKYLIGKANTRRVWKESSKRKIGDANRGRKVSEATRQKISKAISGEKNGNYGKPLTSEQRQIISNYQQNRFKSKEARDAYIYTHPNRKEVMCVTNNRIYPSINNASKELHIDRSHIRGVLSGKYKNAKGYVFKLARVEV